MSGKPNEISRWGGKRRGAGRLPKYMLTDNQIKAMMRKAKAYAKQYGKTVDEILLDIVYAKLGRTKVSPHINNDINRPSL